MSDTQDILAAERRWVEIYKANDAGHFAALLADEFVYTSPVGEKVPRQTYLDNLANRTVVMTSVEPSDEEVGVHGDTAVVTATWDVDEAYRGHAFKGPVRITRTWVRNAAGWQALAFQVTNVETH